VQGLPANVVRGCLDGVDLSPAVVGQIASRHDCQAYIKHPRRFDNTGRGDSVPPERKPKPKMKPTYRNRRWGFDSSSLRPCGDSLTDRALAYTKPKIERSKPKLILDFQIKRVHAIPG
jgi:hypothetical protein